MDCKNIASNTFKCGSPYFFTNFGIRSSGNGSINGWTAASVALTGTSLPSGVGVYAPTPNQLGFASNSAAAGLVDKNQGWVANGGAATISSGGCGTGTNGTISGSNNRGQVTIGAVATSSCTVTFSAAYTAAPYCTVFPASSGAAVVTIDRLGF